MKTLRPTDLNQLFESLTRRGFVVVGPTVKDQAIVYDELNTPADLPMGWTDDQDGGAYRLVKRSDLAYFGFALGPQTWKQFLFPPVRRLWSAVQSGAGFDVEKDPSPETRYAMIGVRSCELRAIAIQDRVFIEGEYVDDVYKALRERLLIVAVNCTRAGGTCFCVSTGTGPEVARDYDLLLTEIVDGDKHYFTAVAGTDTGESVLSELPGRDTTRDEKKAVEKAVANAARQMGRTMETDGLKEILYASYDHPQWEDVANRCLTCGNCTMVCPTCFCSDVKDTNDLTGERAERWRYWDSCFTFDFSYIHGGQVRRTAKARYRQWMTHKLATWQDQFGVMGCVGCGRCITWCPVGIDITKEVHAIRTDVKNKTSR